MNHLALGLMSGTSADGVSAALGSFKGHTFKLMGALTESYPVDVVKKIRQGGALTTDQLSELNVELGHLFGKAAVHLLKKTHTKPDQVLCIGSHGQTIYHGPDDTKPNTLQIGDAAVIAEKTGLPVVSNFRQRDIAAGGEGAPLIPFFDQYFYGQGPVRAMLNIGGMANLTIVGKGIEKPLAFDTGPGNSLMDRAIQQITNGKEAFDHHGKHAKHGTMNMEAISQMMEHPYFKKPPPKSTGPEVFGEAFLKKYLHADLNGSINNVMATLNYLTCISIQESFRSHVFKKFQVSEIIVSGGGAYNKTLMKKLECLFAPIPVQPIEQTGLPTLAKEPLAFAFFGFRSIQNKINHLPFCTGAKKACVLGSLTRP